MSNKDYRELQISSSQLVIIFLAIIILGVIIFLLGISVGKKQSDIVLASQAQTQMGAESITQEDAVPVDKPEEKATQASSPEETKIATPKASANRTTDYKLVCSSRSFSEQPGRSILCRKIQKRRIQCDCSQSKFFRQKQFVQGENWWVRNRGIGG